MKRVLPNVGQQFHQLPMFMSAREIRSQYQANDGDRHEVGDFDYESDDQLFARKYDEAHAEYDYDDSAIGDPNTPSLGEHIRRHGVHSPIALQAPGAVSDMGWHGRPQIFGGHHRVAVMDRHRPNDLMPVAHFEDADQARESLGNRY